jgi:hypothetical protein
MFRFDSSLIWRRAQKNKSTCTRSLKLYCPTYRTLQPCWNYQSSSSLDFSFHRYHLRRSFSASTRYFIEHDNIIVPPDEPREYQSSIAENQELTVNEEIPTTSSSYNLSDFPTDYLDGFIKTIQRNVDRILQQQSSSNQAVKERWQRHYEKERHRFFRKRNKKIKQLSVSEMWDRAVLFCNLPILSEPSHNNINDNNNDNEHLRVSPIFELPLNKQWEIDDLDQILQTMEETSVEGPDFEDSQTVDDSVLTNFESIYVSSHDDPNDRFHDAISRSISLLSVMKPNEWRNIEFERYEKEETKDNNMEEVEQSDDGDIDRFHNINIQDFLNEAAKNHYTISTVEANLLLAYLVTSIDADSDAIIHESIQLYNEMKLIETSGQQHCQPNATTYRILILAFNGRFTAPSEAIKLSQEMIEDSSAELTPEILVEVVKSCHSKMDLATARNLIDLALEKREIRPSIGSFILFIEMMKSQDLRDEALSFYDRLSEVRKLKLYRFL